MASVVAWLQGMKQNRFASRQNFSESIFKSRHTERLFGKNRYDPQGWQAIGDLGVHIKRLFGKTGAIRSSGRLSTILTPSRSVARTMVLAFSLSNPKLAAHI
jgi:hypothetical protein